MRGNMRAILSGGILSVQQIPSAELMREVVALTFAAGLENAHVTQLGAGGYRVNVTLPEHQDAAEMASLLLVVASTIMGYDADMCITSYKGGSNYDVEARAAAPKLTAR